MKKSVLFTAAAVALVATGAGITAQAESFDELSYQQQEEMGRRALADYEKAGYDYEAIVDKYPEELLSRLALHDRGYIRSGYGR